MNTAMRFLILVTGSALLACPPSVLQAADTIVLKDCFLAAKNEVLVPAQEAGVLAKLPVHDGQQVAKGDLLAQIDDIIPMAQYKIAEFKLKVAEEQASNDIEVRYAKAGYDVAAQKLDRSLRAASATVRAVSQDVIDEQQLEKVKFWLSIDNANKTLQVAKLQREVSKAELDAAKANLTHRRIVSPLDAMVVEIKYHEGEWVQEGNMVMRLVGVDVLRVESRLFVQDHRPTDIQGRPVSVVVTLAGGQRETFPGKIVFVSPLVSSDGAFQVRAEVQNQRQGDAWILSPGMKAEMTIQLK